MRPSEHFVAAEKGSISVVFGLSLVTLCLCAGLAVDYGSWVRDRTAMQSVADAAALGGAIAFSNKDATTDTAESAALALVQKHNSGSIAGFTATAAADSAQKTVLVQLQRPGLRTFSAFALGADPIVKVAARGKVAPGSTGGSVNAGLCVLALDPSMDRALLASGGGLIWAKDCWVQVNSTSTKAVNFSGNSVLTSGRNCFVGDVDQGLALMSPNPEPACAPVPDPFAGYAMPGVGPCDYYDFKVSGGTPTLSPGVYCDGLTLSSVTKATLQPGLYVIKDGLFTMSGGGILEGDGVTLYLTGTNAGLNWSGGGSYHLVAPAKDQAGIPGFVVFLDPKAAARSKSVISGTGQMYYEGILYFPTQQVEVSGTGLTEALASPYTIYIANNFLYSGSSQMVVNADATKTSVYVPNALSGAQGGGAAVLIE